MARAGPFGGQGLPTSAATPSALHLPPEQHAALQPPAAVIAVTGYSSSTPLFFGRPVTDVQSPERRPLRSAVVQKIALTAIVDQLHNFKLEATPARTPWPDVFMKRASGRNS